MTETITPDAAPEVDDGITVVDGKRYMADAKGNLVPVELIKGQDQLEDQTVRKIIGFARRCPTRSRASAVTP